MSNIQQIKQISIRAYLAEQGLHPVKNNPRYGLYLSPLREEHSPSFKVDYMQNLWYDFGLGEGGSIIDLVMRMERCNAGEAMRRLERHIDGMQTSPLSPSGFSSSRLGEAIQNCSALAPQRRFIGKNPAPQRPPSIVVVQVRPLDNSRLARLPHGAGHRPCRSSCTLFGGALSCGRQILFCRRIPQRCRRLGAAQPLFQGLHLESPDNPTW